MHAKRCINVQVHAYLVQVNACWADSVLSV
jgi:hypothetical protein